MIGATCDAYDRVVIAALCSPAGRFALPGDVAGVRRDLTDGAPAPAPAEVAVPAPAERPGDRLLARIERWCDAHAVRETELGRVAVTYPGFVGLLRERGSISAAAEKMSAFLDAHPDGLRAPIAAAPAPAARPVVAGAPVARPAKPAFRSWAEDYDHRAAEAVAIDRQAFANRARQRAQTARAGDTSNAAVRSAVENAEAERAAAQRRQTVPIERARLFLQRKGLAICRADVVGRRADRWAVSGRKTDLDDAELIELAGKKGFTG